MTKTTQGKMHGSTIELVEDIGLADGQEVEVVIRPINAPTAWGDGIHRSAGAAANMPEWDAALAEIERERKA